jgi:hypothetical protein
MLGVLRVLLIIALAVVAVSTAQHAHADRQLAAHAAQPGHAHDGHERGHERGHEHGSGHEPATCCPSLSLHCGTGAVLCEETWRPAEPLTLAISQSPQDRLDMDATFPEFEPPPPRS